MNENGRPMLDHRRENMQRSWLLLRLNIGDPWALEFSFSYESE